MARFKYAIIDLDIPLFKAAAIAQKTVYHLYDPDGDFIQTFQSAKDCKAHLSDMSDFLGLDVSTFRREPEVVVGKYEEAEKALDHLIERYIKDADAEMGWFSIGHGDINFRDDIAVEKKYKGNREGMTKPVHHKRLKEYAIKKYTPVLADGVESDDLICIRLYEDTENVKRLKDKSKAECVLIALEKDCKNSVGHLYFPDTKETIWNTTLEANRWVAYQSLTGDSADNYSGLPKVGPKKAAAMLEGLTTTTSIMDTLCTAYKDHYGTNAIETHDWQGQPVTRFWHDYLRENVRLAYMLREGDKDEEWKKLFKGCVDRDEVIG